MGLLNLVQYTAFAEVLIVSTLIFCYYNWVAHGGDRILPSISDTWSIVPGTYLSRAAAAPFAVLMMPIVFAVFRYTVGASPADSTKRVIAYVSFVLFIVSMFFFSWVPSICNTTAASCRGDSDIHDIIATIFFVCADLATILIYAFFFRSKKFCDTLSGILLIILQILSKLRFTSLFRDQVNSLFDQSDASTISPLGLDDPAFGIFEWTDVFTMLLLIYLFVRHYCKDFYVGFHNVSELPSGYKASWTVLNSTLMTIGGSLLLAMVITNVCIFEFGGYAPNITGVPSISDLALISPDNWFAHWILYFAAFLSIVAQVGIWIMRAESTKCARYTQIANANAIAGMVGLAFSGISLENEDIMLHRGGVAAFITLTTFYMAFTVFGLFDSSDFHSFHPASAVFLTSSMSYAVLACIGFWTSLCYDPESSQDFGAITGYVHMAVFIVFQISYGQSLKGQIDSVRFVLARKVATNSVKCQVVDFKKV